MDTTDKMVRLYGLCRQSRHNINNINSPKKQFPHTNNTRHIIPTLNMHKTTTQTTDKNDLTPQHV